MRRSLLPCMLVACFLPSSAEAQERSPDAQPETPPAQPEASPEDPARMQEAREHFEAGSRHYAAREFRDAIREFELSNSLLPSADLAYNVARCYEQVNEYPAAVEYYGRYLREKIDPPDRDEVEQKIHWLREQIEAQRVARRQRTSTGSLRLGVEPAGAAISLDGRAVGKAPLVEPLSVPPGEHRLDVRAEGYQDWVSRVEIRAGDTTSAVAEMRPATVHEAVRGRRLWTWVVGGAAVLSAVGGLILGVDAQATMNDAQATLDDEASGVSYAERRAIAYDLRDDARAQADRADYLFGGAIVLGVTAAILYFVEGSSVSTESHPATEVARR